MRRTLIPALLAATLAPLVLLVGGAWVRWVGSWLAAMPGTNADDQALLAQADRIANPTATARARDYARMARQLQQALATKTPPTLEPGPYNDARVLADSRIALTELAAAFPANLSPDHWQAKDRAAVQAFQQDRRFQQLRERRPDRARELDAAVERFADAAARRTAENTERRQRQEKLEALLADAGRGVRDAGTRSLLREAQPLLDVDRARYEPQWRALSLRCDFHADYTALRLGSRWPGQTQKLNEFVTRYDRPAERDLLDETERTLLAEVRRRRHVNEHLDAIAAVQAKKFDDVAALANELRPVADLDLAKEPRDVLRKFVVGHLLSQIPALAVPSDWTQRTDDGPLELRQARQRGGKLLVGVWRPGPAANSFRYWETLKTWNADRNGGTLYQAGIAGVVGIEAEPTRWVGFTWLSDYNLARKRIEANPGDRAAWEALANECTRLAEAVDAHVKEHGRPKATFEFGFTAKRDVARQVIDPATWDVIRRCVE